MKNTKNKANYEANGAATSARIFRLAFAFTKKTTNDANFSFTHHK